ncbi:MAG: BrnT family toxin [Lachnospiraceae bacterium]|nr:BrnT family toxin [Lachnospiraceae bacterium]
MYEYFDFDYEHAVFEWDEEKAALNFTKHGIRFQTASKVFADENKLIRSDREHPWEERYDILGKIGKILFVVCTFKKENVVRIISARRATESEKARYEYGENYDE